jgi:hypothetical protein
MLEMISNRLLKNSFLAVFLAKPESSFFKNFWTPAFAGVTAN